MKDRRGDGGWSPYVAGALAGVLAIASAVATTKVLGKTSLLGASTTFVRAAGMVERQVAPEHVKANAYFESASSCRRGASSGSKDRWARCVSRTSRS